MGGRPVLRRCVACRDLLDRELLWRVIRLAEGGIALDRGMGRSAYLCQRRSCVEEARRRRRLQRALRCPVAEGILDQLEQRLEAPAAALPQAGPPAPSTPLRQDGLWPPCARPGARPDPLAGSGAPTIGDLNDQQRQSQNL